jgi:DNA repair protein RadC
MGARAFVLVCRHRDGSLEPIQTEIMVARALATQAAAAGIPVLGHLVVGNVGGYQSTHEEGGGT